MRWTLSLTAVSGRPTRTVLGRPAETSTSTSTGRASMPTSAKAFNLASTAILPTRGQEMRLLFPEDEINRPAAADVRPLVAAVLDQLLVIATGVKQGIGEDGKASIIQSALRHLALFIDGCGNAAHRGVIPAEDGGRQGR